MKFVIVTGMSGAGRSTAMKMMEDMGFYCIDNLPIPLLDKLADLTINLDTEIEKVAVGIDVRTGDGFAQGIILHYDTTEDDNSTAKRYGGMGSTDATKTN